jgi:hypothetical protein
MGLKKLGVKRKESLIQELLHTWKIERSILRPRMIAVYEYRSPGQQQ